MTTRIYSAITPYHLLLVGALQVASGDAPSIVMFRDESGFLGHVGTITSALPNVQLELLEPLNGSSKWQRAIKFRRSGNALLASVRALRGDAELYTFNSTGWDILRAVHQLKGTIPVHFVEDGLDAYLPHSSHPYVSSSLLRHYGKRVLNGVPPPAYSDMTRTMRFDRFHLLFPDICRSTIPLERVQRIQGAWFRESVERFSMITDRFLPDVSPTDIYLPGLSDSTTDASSVVSLIEEWLTSIRATSPGSVCAVKLHPRERNRELLSRLDCLDLIRYPNWIPAELLVHSLDPLCRIRAGLTTFILSSKILVPERRIWLESSINHEYADTLKQWDSSISMT